MENDLNVLCYCLKVFNTRMFLFFFLSPFSLPLQLCFHLSLLVFFSLLFLLDSHNILGKWISTA